MDDELWASEFRAEFYVLRHQVADMEQKVDKLNDLLTEFIAEVKAQRNG